MREPSFLPLSLLVLVLAASPAAAAGSGADAAASIVVAVAERPLRVAAAAPQPRLRMDLTEPALSPEAAAVEIAIEAVAEAASAVRAQQAAASAAAARIAALERSVQRLGQEAREARDDAAALRAAADARSRATVLWIAAVAALGLLAAYLAWRLSTQGRGPRRAGRGGAATQADDTAGPQPGAAADAPAEVAAGRLPTAPVPFVTSALQMPAGAPSPRPRSTPAWTPPSPAAAPARRGSADGSRDSLGGPGADASDAIAAARAAAASTTVAARSASSSTAAPAASPVQPPARAPAAALAPQLSPSSGRPQPDAALDAEAADERTEAMSPPSRLDGTSPREVSIEELIDLEQQAEFFVVLGQDDAAIDVLVQHLRDTGGGSPMPYLKLLEIHRRRGDGAAYQRMRSRFNRRFNAYAPDWGDDPSRGRGLEDYPGVLPRLQQVWGHPLSAMAELEALLFRKSRGELFDLPAYDEVLFLYTMARDLLDRESASTGTVDLLLPLDDPPAGAAGGASGDPAAAGGAPEAPALPSIDLDLTLQPRPTSIFDPLDDAASEPRRS